MTESRLDSRTQRNDLIELFARELSTYVGRSAQRLRREGLHADDFDGQVLVDLADGSTMTFAHAIVVQHKSGVIGVFTEHCGYYAFQPVDVRVSRVWDGHVFGRYGDLPEREHSLSGRLTLGGREYVALPSAAYNHLSRAEPTTDAVVSLSLSIARDLRAARRHAGLTRLALAKRLRKSLKTVCKSELGRYRVSASYIRKVLAACGLPDDWRGPPRE